MTRDVVLTVSMVVAVLLTGCSIGGRGESDGLFGDGGPISDEERAVIDDRIADLAYARSLDNPDHEAAYNEAIEYLTLQGGSRIEYILVEELAGNEDWGIRYGVINVLDSVGTKTCVEPLIAALADAHHLVAYKALQTLRVVTDHREIPEQGGEEGGLPAVPPPAEGALTEDEQLAPWIAWHGEHAQALRDAWLEWWEANRAGITIE